MQGRARRQSCRAASELGRACAHSVQAACKLHDGNRVLLVSSSSSSGATCIGYAWPSQPRGGPEVSGTGLGACGEQAGNRGRGRTWGRPTDTVKTTRKGGDPRKHFPRPGAHDAPVHSTRRVDAVAHAGSKVSQKQCRRPKLFGSTTGVKRKGAGDAAGWQLRVAESDLQALGVHTRENCERCLMPRGVRRDRGHGTDRCTPFISTLCHNRDLVTGAPPQNMHKHGWPREHASCPERRKGAAGTRWPCKDFDRSKEKKEKRAKQREREQVTQREGEEDGRKSKSGKGRWEEEHSEEASATEE